MDLISKIIYMRGVTQALTPELLTGLSTHIGPLRSTLDLLLKRSPHTHSYKPEYGYAVWMRHWLKSRDFMEYPTPQSVAELGPGDSLGACVAALCTGAKKALALDVVDYPVKVDAQGIYELFQSRREIPHSGDIANIKPALSSYSYPEDLTPCAPNLELVERICPWNHLDALPAKSVDFIYSQAVLEHVEDLDLTYQAMKHWLRPGGVSSHQIDFKCHGTARDWNGHWSIGKRTWSLIKGRRPFLINRAPLSEHLASMKRAGLKVLHLERQHKESRLRLRDLSREFRTMPVEDLKTSGAFVVIGA